MAKDKKSLLVANTFGALGYISNLTQWMWAALIVAYPLLTTGSTWSLPNSPALASEPAVFVPTGQFAIFLVALITVAVVVMTIYALIMLPRSVGKAGAKVTRSVASASIPILVHHKKITKTQRRKLSYRIVLVLKLISALLPALIVVIAPSVAPIAAPAALGAAIFFSLITCLYFVLQYSLAYVFKADKTSLW